MGGATDLFNKDACTINKRFSGGTGGYYFCKQFATLSGMATVTKLGDKYYKIVLDPSYDDYGNIGHIMFSAQGIGDGVVVAKNEEIL